MPRNITPSVAIIQINVVEAFFNSGCLKAGTPFEIASTPVSAVQPAANARRIRKMLSGSAAAAVSASCGAAATQPPLATR